MGGAANRLISMVLSDRTIKEEVAAGRLVFDQEGYVATVVNGEVIIDNGKPTGAVPGEVLRFNRS